MFSNLFEKITHHGDRGDGSSSGFGRGPPPGLLLEEDVDNSSSWKHDARADRSAAVSNAGSAASPEAYSFSEPGPPPGDMTAGRFASSKGESSRGSSPGKTHGEKKVKKHKRRAVEEPPMDAYRPAPVMDPNMNGGGYPPPMHMGPTPAEYTGGMDMAGVMQAPGGMDMAGGMQGGGYQPPMQGGGYPSPMPMGPYPSEYAGGMDMSGGMQGNGYPPQMPGSGHPPPMPLGPSPPEYGGGMDMAGGMQAPDMTYNMAPNIGGAAGHNDWINSYERSPPSEGSRSVSPGSSSTAHRRGRRHHRSMGETPSISSSGAAQGGEAPLAPNQGSPMHPYTPGSGQGFVSDLQWAYSNPDRGQHSGVATTPQYDPTSARGIGSSNWSTPSSAVGNQGNLHNEVPLSWSMPHGKEGPGVAWQNESQQAQIDDALQAIWGSSPPSHPSEMPVARGPQMESASQAATWPNLASAPAQTAQFQQAGAMRGLDLDWAKTYSTNTSSIRTETVKDLDLSWVKPASSSSMPKSTGLDDPLIRTVFASAPQPSSMLGSALADADYHQRKKDRIIEQLQDEFKKLRERQKDDLIQQLQEEMRRKEQQHKDMISKLQVDLKTKEHENAALVEKMQGEIKLREQKNETLVETLQAAVKERETTHLAQVEQLQSEIKRLQQGQKDALVEHLQEEISKLKDEVLAPRPNNELVMGTVLEPSASAEPASFGFVLDGPQNDNGAPTLAAMPDWSSMPMGSTAAIGATDAPAWSSEPRSLPVATGPAAADSWSAMGSSAAAPQTQIAPTFGQSSDKAKGFRKYPSFGPEDDESFRQDSPWMIDRETFARYRQAFFDADRNHDGFVEGQEAREVMDKTKLPPEELAVIWFLSDTDQDGRLAWGEFLCAMHIAQRRSQEGVPIPEVLPSELAMHIGSPAPGESSNSMATGSSSDMGFPSLVESSTADSGSAAWLEGARQEPVPPEGPMMAGQSTPQPAMQPPQAAPAAEVSLVETSPWAVGPEEAERYHDIFRSEADLQGTGYAGPWEAKQVLEQSNLPVGELSTIWQVSDMDMDGRLDVLEFTCAMALVARRLQGAPLPAGSPPPELLASLAALGLQSKPPGAAAFPEQSPPASPASQLSDRGVLSPGAPGPSGAPVAPDVSGAAAAAPGVWAPTSEELQRFQVVFESLCGPAVGGSGVLGADEGRELFERSGLSLDELSHIWRISDADCDGQLAPAEFVCAMTLVARRRQGAPLPPELPMDLAQKLSGP